MIFALIKNEAIRVVCPVFAGSKIKMRAILLIVQGSGRGGLAVFGSAGAMRYQLRESQRHCAKTGVFEEIAATV